LHALVLVPVLGSFGAVGAGAHVALTALDLIAALVAATEVAE